MKLLRKGDLPVDNDLTLFAEPIASNNRGFILGIWKKFSVAVVVLVAFIATSGWLYLIAKSVGAFVHWL